MSKVIPLLLADIFGNFRNKCIEIYELDPAHFLPAPGLACQACLHDLHKIYMICIAIYHSYQKE